MREIQESAVEKPKLENSRKMRGIYFNDSGDKEHVEITKNAGRKLEVHMEAVVPCRKKNPRPLMLSGNCSRARSTKQSSEDRVRLYSGVS